MHNMGMRLQPPKADHRGTPAGTLFYPLSIPPSHSDQPKDGHRWHGHGWDLLSLLADPSWEFVFSTLFMAHVVSLLLMSCCQLKSLSGLPGVLPSPPVPAALLCPCLCRHAQDDVACCKPLGQGLPYLIF